MGVDRRENDVARERVNMALSAAAQQAAHEAARKTARRAARGYFVLLLFLLIGAGLYQRSVNHELDQAAERLDRGEIVQCERVQTQRESTNVSEARQFLLLSAVAASPRASDMVKARYRVLANTTLYAPPTDCPEAVAHPETYRRPPSLPFYALPISYVESVVQAAKDKRPQPTP